MTPNRFKIAVGHGPGEMDLVRSFLTFKLEESQQVYVSLDFGQFEEGYLYVSGLRHSQDGYQFWGQYFVSFADREDRYQNRFQIEGFYDSHKREGSFWVSPITSYRLVFVHADDEEQYRYTYASFGPHTSSVPESLLKEMKVGHWAWEDPSIMRYYLEHLEADFDGLQDGAWRPISEIRITGDKQNTELEIIDL